VNWKFLGKKATKDEDGELLGIPDFDFVYTRCLMKIGKEST
jgi:hypothetical protein